MADIVNAKIGNYQRNWIGPYSSDQFPANKDLRLDDALTAARNYYWMAVDLANLQLDAAFQPRVYLCRWLLYYYNAIAALHESSGRPTQLKKKTVIQPMLRELLGSQTRMLRDILVYLGVDLMQALDPDLNAPEYLTMPNAQPLELFVNCMVQSSDNVANLGALQSLMLRTHTVDRQRTNAVMNGGLDVGLPSVVFVCFTDKIVNCSADQWQDVFKTHRLNLLEARRERFASEEKKRLVDSRTMIADRWGYVEDIFIKKDDKFKPRAVDGQLSIQEYNDFVQGMYGINFDSQEDPSKRGGTHLNPKEGNNHLGEVGRAFHGSGMGMFGETSRCWKCRFLHHYKSPRPGDPNNTGLKPEEPTQTSWACNRGLACAEDLCHQRCWKRHNGGTGDNPEQEFAFKPYPYE